MGQVQKMLSQNLVDFWSLLSDFSYFMPYFEIYLDSPEEVPPEITGPQTNSTLHRSQRMFGQKFVPSSQDKIV